MQPPIKLGFTLTKYKIQGAIFDKAVVDLKRHFGGSIATHKRVCSTYVQLSRLHTFAGLGLLQPIDITDINNQPYLQLYNKDLRLDNISRTTSDAWKEEIKTRRL